MARYTCSYTIALPFDSLRQSVVDVLKTFPLNIIYETGDYLMAREIPGKISYAKLVTLEVLLDRTTATEKETRMSLVMKNEELPLQVDNHCHQMFDLVNQAIMENRQWQLVETVAGELPTI